MQSAANFFVSISQYFLIVTVSVIYCLVLHCQAVSSPREDDHIMCRDIMTLCRGPVHIKAGGYSRSCYLFFRS